LSPPCLSFSFGNLKIDELAPRLWQLSESQNGDASFCSQSRELGHLLFLAFSSPSRGFLW
jgi:hypothetical protein